MRSAPEHLLTPRLLLRRPLASDIEAIFRRYASDPEVTKYLAWPRHQRLEETEAFLELSDHEWTTHGCGPYLILLQSTEAVLGSTGLHIVGPMRASTGYVLARDAWRHGYATEATLAIAALAERAGIVRLEAHCHTEHHASARVLEKSGFSLEGVQRRSILFPQIDPTTLLDVRCYVRLFPTETG